MAWRAEVQLNQPLKLYSATASALCMAVHAACTTVRVCEAAEVRSPRRPTDGVIFGASAIHMVFDGGRSAVFVARSTYYRIYIL
jgi:hypothetical protein